MGHFENRVAYIQGYKELDQKGPTFLAGDQHEQTNGIRFISSPLPLCVPLQVTNTNAAPPVLKLLRAMDLAEANTLSDFVPGSRHQKCLK